MNKGLIYKLGNKMNLIIHIKRENNTSQTNGSFLLRLAAAKVYTELIAAHTIETSQQKVISVRLYINVMINCCQNRKNKKLRQGVVQNLNSSRQKERDLP